MAAARRRWLRGFCGTLFRAVICCTGVVALGSVKCQGAKIAMWAMWAKIATTVECS
jgi:hypothetical protein